jgi:hypothetical protein
VPIDDVEPWGVSYHTVIESKGLVHAGSRERSGTAFMLDIEKGEKTKK